MQAVQEQRHLYQDHQLPMQGEVAGQGLRVVVLVAALEVVEQAVAAHLDLRQKVLQVLSTPVEVVAEVVEAIRQAAQVHQA